MSPTTLWDILSTLPQSYGLKYPSDSWSSLLWLPWFFKLHTSKVELNIFPFNLSSPYSPLGVVGLVNYYPITEASKQVESQGNPYAPLSWWIHNLTGIRFIHAYLSILSDFLGRDQLLLPGPFQKFPNSRLVETSFSFSEHCGCPLCNIDHACHSHGSNSPVCSPECPRLCIQD
jgi:hypothetical protein